MSRISNLVKAGYITKTGLVGSAIAEAWTATKMLQNQTITKTGLNPIDLEMLAVGTEHDYFTFEAVDACVFTFNSSGSLQYSIDDGETWSAATDSPVTPEITAG